MAKAVLFDLDGTLLPMDQKSFTEEYFSLLTKKMKPFGYDPETLVRAILHGTEAMVKNNGKVTNETVFWNDFAASFGEQVRTHVPLFLDFYTNEYQHLKDHCGFNEEAAETVYALRDAKRRVVLATNPLFPAAATESRIRWAGLEPEDFELYTTYENFSYCKPNPKYYREILRRLELNPEDCVMVGNDIDVDIPADEVGIKVYLLTDCLVNRNEKDISAYPHGNFTGLRKWLGI